jgi:hypothetical protein
VLGAAPPDWRLGPLGGLFIVYDIASSLARAGRAWAHALCVRVSVSSSFNVNDQKSKHANANGFCAACAVYCALVVRSMCAKKSDCEIV